MIALERLLDRIMVDNPNTTVPQGLFRFESRTYPNIALREALLNAFVHADYRTHDPILVKQFKHRIEIGACARPLMLHFSQRLAQRLGGASLKPFAASYARSMRSPIDAIWLGGKRQASYARSIRVLCVFYAAADRRNKARRETSGEYAPNRGAADDRSHGHQPDR